MTLGKRRLNRFAWTGQHVREPGDRYRNRAFPGGSRSKQADKLLCKLPVRFKDIHEWRCVQHNRGMQWQASPQALTRAPQWQQA